MKAYREGMDSKSIRKQLSAHFAIMEKEILMKSLSRHEFKEYIYSKKKEQGRRVSRKKNEVLNCNRVLNFLRSFYLFSDMTPFLEMINDLSSKIDFIISHT